MTGGSILREKFGYTFSVLEQRPSKMQLRVEDHEDTGDR